ncbi:MAG: 30S ribosomal protein S27ae [Candidatus Woesearchaeota archaeon]|jgi:small subunit ribosomal protein S27Ae|nr:30S ribosomal protein S27ae [Candidatus Woesearchaeota archaeon]
MTKSKEKAKSSAPSKKYEAYSDGKKVKKECPKCGRGIFLAEHKDRFHCGKCAYTEFK